MTTQDTIKEIKLELRAAMNGVVAAQMRQAGMPYKLIFGVELPRLQEIAREFRADRRLAQDLWNESSRECKILATMLMPPAECLAEIAEIWTDEMPTAEIAQIAVQQLFSHTRWAADTAFCWIASDHTMREQTYNPEFAADSTAVSTTKFITSPANGMPMLWNTSTNGLASTPDCFQGISAAMTAIEPMKKIARRNTVVCTAFGIARSGFLVSPAATPTTSVPEKANTTVRSVENTGIIPLGNQPER